MRVGILGRSKNIIRLVELLEEENHKIEFLVSSKHEKHHEISLKDLEKFCQKKKIKFINSLDFKFIEKKISLVDIVLSMNFRTMIPIGFINKFKFGVLNSHAGDLPKYIGNATTAWSILQKEKKITVSIHKMNEKLDEGFVIIKKSKRINQHTYITEIYKWFETVVPKMFLNAINIIYENPKLLIKNQFIKKVECYPRRDLDSKINWQSNVEDILLLIRASSRPFEGAITTLEGKDKVRIFRAREFKSKFKILSVPGQVINNNNQIVISCNNGYIELEDFMINSLSFEKSKSKILLKRRNRLI